MTIKSTIDRHGSRHRTLLIVSLALVAGVLIFAFFEYSLLATDSGSGPMAIGTDGSTHVKSATELRNAINNVKVGGHVKIVLNEDISLDYVLTIPADTDITLTSTDKTNFFRLVGLDGQNTIVVNSGAVLTLDGIIVTHKSDYSGQGVLVDGDATLIMIDGKISGNSNPYTAGGGVNIRTNGVFKLVGGEISDNIAAGSGGVYTAGVFEMLGGKITNNQAKRSSGGGVYVDSRGSFTLTNGEISNNTATCGGGVYVINGQFSMSGGIIANNIALSGGGVHNNGVFAMSGGKITNNQATTWSGYKGGDLINNAASYGASGGGVYEGPHGSFIMSGGEISGNTAAYGGGVAVCGQALTRPEGVAVWQSQFTMRNGAITNNTATQEGGGIYCRYGTYKKSGGELGNNIG